VNGLRYGVPAFGNKTGRPLLFLQHFTGLSTTGIQLFTDPLASGREVILFDNAGIGRSTGDVPKTMAEMANRVFAFLDGLRLTTCDVLGFSIGGVIAHRWRRTDLRSFVV